MSKEIEIKEKTTTIKIDNDFIKEFILKIEKKDVIDIITEILIKREDVIDEIKILIEKNTLKERNWSDDAYNMEGIFDKINLRDFAHED